MIPVHIRAGATKGPVRERGDALVGHATAAIDATQAASRECGSAGDQAAPAPRAQGFPFAHEELSARTAAW
jgi:hypothetical protein